MLAAQVSRCNTTHNFRQLQRVLRAGGVTHCELNDADHLCLRKTLIRSSTWMKRSRVFVWIPRTVGGKHMSGVNETRLFTRYTQTHTRTYIYIYIYLYTHIHTHMYTRIYCVLYAIC